MSYCLALVLAAMVVLVLAVVRSARPDPRHDFVFRMLARVGPGNVVAGLAPDEQSDVTERRRAS